jgi:hypothetical protein
MGLGQYFTAFLVEEMFLEECESMVDSIMDKLGVKQPEHRARLRKACRKLGTQSLQTRLTTKAKKAASNGKTSTGAQEDSLEFSSRKSAVFLKQELAQMDFVKSTSWINHSELEYTKQLGRGTSGKVYQGLFKGKEVAIKVLKDVTEEAQLLEFKKEFQIMR